MQAVQQCKRVAERVAEQKIIRLVVLVEPMVMPVSVSCGRCNNLRRDKFLRADQEFGETGLTTVLKVLGCKASTAQHVDPTLRSSALWILPRAPAAEETTIISARLNGGLLETIKADVLCIALLCLH